MAEMTLNKRHFLYQEDLDKILSLRGIEVFHNKSFLITGATGQIGVCMIDALMKYASMGHAVTVYAVGRSKEKAALRLGEYYSNPSFHFIEQDVRMPFSDELKVDYIIPLASNTHPLAYSQYPIETIGINIKGIENALELAVRCGADVLYPSTVEIYGNARGNDVFKEDYTGMLNLSTSRSCYPESKRVSEAMCQSFIVEKGVRCKVARLSRVFGPTILASDTKASSQFIKNALAHENIVLKSNGNQFFSYTYVADAVSALFYILIHGENGFAYNVANEKCNIHLVDFARICASVARSEVVIESPSESERSGYSIAVNAILDNSSLMKLGWEPCFHIENAITRTIQILSCEKEC